MSKPVKSEEWIFEGYVRSPEKGFDISALVEVEKVTGRDLSKGRLDRMRKARRKR